MFVFIPSMNLNRNFALLFLLILLIILTIESIPVAIPVTISLTVTILGTITIAVTVLAFAHVNVINDSCQFRELMFVAQYVDVAVAGFWSYVGTAYVYADVCYTTDDGGIGHHTDRRGIENHIVVTLLQLVDGVIQYAACHQLGRIRRYGAARQDV